MRQATLTLLLTLLSGAAGQGINNTTSRNITSSSTTSRNKATSGFTSASTATDSLLLDNFNGTSVNALGYFHGVIGTAEFKDFVETDGTYLKVTTGDLDAAYVSGLGEGCGDFTTYKDHYIHIQYNGSAKFSVSLQQHNKACDDTKLPFPETWDSVQAARYTSADKQEIYIPVSHFHVDLERLNGIALENWYTNDTTNVYKIELLPPSAIPSTTPKVAKLDTGTLHTSCSKPNLIAFGIDDGQPELMQQTLQIIKDERIPVTFFVQGSALLLDDDEGTNFTTAYREMIKAGHQIGLHSQTHPHLEGGKTDEDIQQEIVQNIATVKDKLNIESDYFRPPFGTMGSRTRQAVGRNIPNSQLIMWSIDVMDWVYGVDPKGDPTKQQYKAFEDSLNKGGDIVVMHYLYPSTVDQFRDMIKLARSKGRQFVRMDQCIGDPDAPETWGWKRG